MNFESNKQRLLFLDNLKVLFSILVIFQHARVTYGGTGWWYYLESIPVDDFSIIFFILLSAIGGFFQASLMGLFFLMGGYFTPNSYDRKGIRSFWKERLLRLGTPVLLYIFVINPIMIYSLAAVGLYPHQLPGSVIGFLTNFGPMWFLVVLLIFTGGYTLWRQITKIDGIQRRIPKEFSIPKYIYLFVLALVLGFCTFLVRIFFSIDNFPLGLPIPFIFQYIMMFSIGVIIVRYDWMNQMTRRHVKIWGFIIVVAFFLFFLYAIPILGFETDYSILMGGFNIHALLFTLVENIICVGMIFALLKIFYAKFNKQGKILRNLSSSAFYIYLIHPPILVLVSLIFVSIPFIPVIKLAIVFPLTVIFCYLFSHFVLEKIHFRKKRNNLEED